MTQQQTLSKILIFGGTFCPPHQAHIALAKAAFSHGHFDQMIFVPCQTPVLDKTIHIAIKDRVAMLTLALQAFPQATLSLCEIERKTPSYTITTLQHFRKIYGQYTSLTLLIGMDNFFQLPRWHQWNKIFDYAHLLVVDRPGIPENFEGIYQQLLNQYATNAEKNRENKAFGTIELMNAGHFDCSSTEIRATIRQAIDNNLNTDALIAPNVRQYIIEHDLFHTENSIS